MDDSKGDTVAYPKAVLGLPFSDQGNSYFFSDDYEMQCKTADQGAPGGGKVRGTFNYVCLPAGVVQDRQQYAHSMLCHLNV